MRTYADSVVNKFVTETNGTAGAGALVTVYTAGSTVKAPLFDVLGAAITNPLSADDEGNYAFKVADGIYDLVINEGALSETRIDRLQIAEIVGFNTDTAHYADLATAQAANLAVSTIITTAGYYATNDGGEGKYVVVAGGTGAVDGGSYLNMLNGNQLELIVSTSIRIEQFGAIGNGVTDDTQAYNNIVNFCNSRPLVLEFGNNKIYRTSGVLNSFEIDVNINGNNSTLIATDGLQASNPSYLTYTTASDFGEYFFELINRDSFGVEVGDLLAIRTDTLWPYDNRGEAHYGEMQRVTFIPSSNENVLMDLAAPGDTNDIDFWSEYTVAANTQVTFYKPRKLLIRNLTIDGDGVSTRAFSIFGYDTPTLENVQIKSHGDTGGGFSKCMSPRVDRFSAYNCYINFATSGTGYGVQFSQCRDAVVNNSTFKAVRRGVDFTGGFPCIGGGVFNSRADQCSSSGFGTHGAAYQVSFSGNNMGDVHSGFLIRGYKCSVINNHIRKCSYLVIVNAGEGLTTKNNRVDRCTSMIWYAADALQERTITTPDEQIYDVIAGNEVNGFSRGIITFSTSSTQKQLNGFIIKDNFGNRRSGGSINNALTGSPSGDLTGFTFGESCVITGNDIKFVSQYTGFFDRNVLIDTKARVNSCWLTNLDTNGLVINKQSGAGTVTLNATYLENFSTAMGSISGQLSFEMTISGGGVQGIQLESPIWARVYPSSGGRLNACHTQASSDGVPVVARIGETSELWIGGDLTGASATFADGTYDVSIKFDQLQSDFRTSKDNSI